MAESSFVLNVKEVKMTKIEKILQFTCQECQTTFQLLEVQQKTSLEVIHNSYDDCQKVWAKLLHQHYQEQIILNLAKQEQEASHD